jgi:hypothetical protein
MISAPFRANLARISSYASLPIASSFEPSSAISGFNRRWWAAVAQGVVYERGSGEVPFSAIHDR